MGRNCKHIVDYFPHDTDSSDSKTLTIIQAKYGNDGYSLWFKLLQLLGRTEGHFYDFNNPTDWEFMLAKMHIQSAEKAREILNTLAALGAIDKPLFEAGIIWSDNFITRITDAYLRRKEKLPIKPKVSISADINSKDVNINGVNDSRSTQRKGKERKGKTPISPTGFENFWKEYPRKVAKTKAVEAFNKINPSEELVAKMIDAVTVQRKSAEWRKDGGQFIPHPSTWLNQRRWEDEINTLEFTSPDAAAYRKVN